MTIVRRAGAPAEKKVVAKKKATALVPAKKTTGKVVKGKFPAKKAASVPAKKTGTVVKGKFPPRKPGAAAKRPARKPLPVFEAPADFKPHFLLVQVKTAADGLFGAENFKAIRYLGKFARDAEDKKKSDMSAYDAATMMALHGRLSGKTFKATNDRKYSRDPKKRDGVKGAHRLPASTTFQILMRVGKRAADNSLTCGIRTIWQAVKNEKTGRVGPKELEKTDPVYRMIRGSSRFLPAAFVNVQMPPKRSRRRAADEADE